MASDPSHNTWRVWLSTYAPILFWIGVIFFLSSPNGASSRTSEFFRPIVEFFYPNAPPSVFETVHNFIRKCAHFTEYAILGILAFRGARRSGTALIKSHYLIFPFLLVAAVASLDEFNQSFEPSRTSSPWDSLLDCIGGLVAIMGCWLAVRRRR